MPDEVAVPLHAPKQVTFMNEGTEAMTEGLEGTVTASVEVQPFASVTVTV